MKTASSGLDHRTVWRWHFYAGLFCIPFILWLSVTGTIFLFHPQIQRWLDRPYAHLTTIGAPAPVSDQVRVALAAVPGSGLHAYQLPFTDEAPAQVLVGKGLKEFRVYVHPRTLQVLKVDDEDKRIDKFVSRLHGELLIGNLGSWIVELAASWAVIMIVTGLFLWWPTSSKGVAGVLYPRLRQGQRIFWRDIHAVTGIYISVFALFLLFTGLPWAKSWGGYLKAVRRITGTAPVKQDWVTSSKAEIAARSTPADTMDGMDMGGMDMSSPEHAEHRKHMTTAGQGSASYGQIDTMVGVVAPLHLTNPVLVSPPRRPGGNWTAKSDTRDRPLRVDLVLDPHTGAILQRTDFRQKALLDRIVGTGIAAHEGQLFGLANQLLGLFTTLGLVTLSLSGLVMWWRRRPEGVLGAPAPIRRIRFSAGLIVFLVVFGVYMPFLGVSLVLVALTERFVLRRIPATRLWLGLYPGIPKEAATLRV
ncbi:Uncharacterized iron-regulated membrane protein [Granulicella pectinivorans]|uniref:Uncharacterized iron-regulated membrane protein n=1 Tax=Granulicella pectinivorans TaxID=474950 RepID=A0A1I6MKI2_9BACT|nr:PepSY domain-containing protein [Granulicella pectinivorans]SFS16182.1 Uncharacterized iron-regulated membrane protein [Granulicella pectinivorans]